MIKRFIRRIIPQSIFELLIGFRDVVRAHERRITDLEYRMKNRRQMAIDELADYIVGADVVGDYLEFGVYRGTTFSYAYKRLSPLFQNMKFFAFDSFEGLPKPQGIDSLNGYSSNFHEKEFLCTEGDFIANLKQLGVNMEKVRVVKGWFDETLKPENTKVYGICKIAAAWIDCDLYESTIPILKFIISHLSVGSVVLFDDWRCFRNLPDFGEQRACREWLSENPHITLRELFSFGWHGIAFTISSC